MSELSTRIFFGQTRQFAPGSIAVRCGIYLSRGIEKVVTILLGNLIVTGRFVRRYSASLLLGLYCRDDGKLFSDWLIDWSIDRFGSRWWREAGWLTVARLQSTKSGWFLRWSAGFSFESGSATVVCLVQQSSGGVPCRGHGMWLREDVMVNCLCLWLVLDIWSLLTTFIGLILLVFWNIVRKGCLIRY